ncbi:MAG: IclR family transcriptional regulator [Desulfobacterales bacterium]
MKSRQFIQSLEKGLLVLKTFSAIRPVLSVSDIAEACDMSMATVHRYLFTLKALGYLEQEAQTRRYRLTPKILGIGFSLLNTMDIKNRLLPYMLETTKVHNVTTQCAILDETEIVILDRVRSKEVVNLDISVGSRLPVFCTAMGKAVLAFLKKADQTRIMRKIKFERHTPFTIGSAQELAADLARIRQAGYVLSDQELTEGLRSVAAPVFRDGQVEGAFGISYAVHRAQDNGLEESLIRQVLETAKKVSF